MRPEQAKRPEHTVPADQKHRILLLMSGSIACAKATQLISDWTKAGHVVRVAITASVPHFVGRATLEGLSGEAVFDHTFEAGQAMDHIHWAQWADLVVACPASANLIARFANGQADDAVTTLWQACWARRAPQFIVPAMNTHMWDYPATQENLARLKSWGIHVLPTAEGALACGEQGAGRMLEPTEIQQRIDAVMKFDQPAAPSGKRLLVTGGGTREPIDAVRYIGNHSSGRTAAILADELSQSGHHVTWLGGVGAIEPSAHIDREYYSSFGDLDQQLQRLLGSGQFDGVIHAAAVSDFSVDRVGASPGALNGKLGSGDSLSLKLTPNPKLLHRLRDYAGDPDLRVIGFKLTAGASQEVALEAVNRLFTDGKSDLVVHNDLGEITANFHSFELHRPDGSRIQAADHKDLAQQLAQFLGAPA